MAESSGTKESRRSHWEHFWEKKHDVTEVYSNADRIARHLSRLVDLRGKKVLEVGAGTGRDSFPLADLGASVVQLDYAYNSLSILKSISFEKQIPAHVVGGDTFSLPFRDGSFDIVFHQGLLEHFRRPYRERLLQENIRVLKKGGLLLVDVPQRYHVYTVAKHILMTFNAWFAGWERSFSFPELQNDLRALGLTPVASYGEWMYPSFLYRVFRELLKKVNVVLPLYPRLISPLSKGRARLRSFLLGTKLPLYTGISIGVVGKKE